MCVFEDTIDNIDNWFLPNPEDISLLVALIIETDNIIEKARDEIKRGRLIALKNISKHNVITQSEKKCLENPHAQDQKMTPAINID